MPRPQRVLGSQFMDSKARAKAKPQAVMAVVSQPVLPAALTKAKAVREAGKPTQTELARKAAAKRVAEIRRAQPDFSPNRAELANIQRLVAGGVNQLTECIRERKKTPSYDAKVLPVKRRVLKNGGLSVQRYRMVSKCGHCHANKNTFLSSGANPPATVHGGQLGGGLPDDTVIAEGRKTLADFWEKLNAGERADFVSPINKDAKPTLKNMVLGDSWKQYEYEMNQAGKTPTEAGYRFFRLAKYQHNEREKHRYSGAAGFFQSVIDAWKNAAPKGLADAFYVVSKVLPGLGSVNDKVQELLNPNGEPPAWAGLGSEWNFIIDKGIDSAGKVLGGGMADGRPIRPYKQRSELTASTRH
jgi:hypothetical protein